MKNNLRITDKRAAMEMSVGTIVTIVLLMTVLILGLVLVRTIFSGAVENINSIDQSVKSEISKLFSEDNSKKVIVYPQSREISIKKGDSGGFGFSIRNNDDTDYTFTYEVKFVEKDDNCGMTTAEIENLIVLGKEDSSGVDIASLESLENPVLVKFDIGDSASLCRIRYNLVIEKDGGAYSSATVDLEIK